MPKGIAYDLRVVQDATIQVCMELGLERIKTALSNLDNPQNKIPGVHVTGTNGKGSVSFSLLGLLRGNFNSIRIGTFTSPFLVSPNDCIRVKNIPISLDVYVD